MDAAYIETDVAVSYQKNYPELELVLEVPYESEGSAIGVCKDNESLLKAVNASIAKALEDGTMDAIECLVTRRSIRNYTKEPVSAGDIENVVEIAQMVSCWENTQPVRYVAVLDNDLKNRIADECTKKFPWNTENIHEAPALIVLCTVKGLSGYEPNGEASTTKGTHWQSFDAGMAADHFCLAARAVDLGTLIMGRYDEEKIKEILDLPEEYDVSCIIAVGHPEVIPAANERKPLKEVLTFR